MSDNISEVLHKLILTYRSSIKQAASQSGIDLPITHIRSLKCIKKIPDCRATDISHRLRLDKSQVARIIKELLSEGCIEKKPHPRNHRSQTLLLTRPGEEIMNAIHKIDQKMKSKMLLGLTDEQVQGFTVIADIMINNLSD
ncbi:MarR family winged helix-turn-helix transcriptional regulator [Marinomonas sp. RSW2]|uniref:MarR family winged helix-turn-helix transcriptional regulator n=1 Tax=Marinomonas maritima TaxID=2940935 RepID=A0ABT5WEW9_9GAMM|nr:MarR family winged helix-turn-helix transcriptional regulator [Marinomonas maritima]MDE8603242.1 MarR family winged helix-turn-helix transcriptional regulator [Marinomonas maritima]